MSVLADYPDWSAHVATASQVAATGVPLLTKNVRVYQQADPNIPGNATHDTGNLSIPQIGYEVLIDVTFASTPTNPFVKVSMLWTDSTTGFQIANDTFYAAGPNPGMTIATHARGPTKADTLKVSYTNLDPSALVTVGVTVLNNSRVYPYDMVRWINSTVRGSTIAGFTLASLSDDPSDLGHVSAATVPASGSLDILLAPGHGGWVNLAGAYGSSAILNSIITVFSVPTSEYSGTGYALRTQAAQTSWTFTFKAPRAPMHIQIFNGTTTASTCSFMALVSP